MRKALTCFVLILSFFLAHSQKKEKCLPIQSKLDVSLHSPIDQTPDAFFLKISTEEVFDCQDYEIVYKTKIIGNDIYVKLLGVCAPQDCQTKLAPATCMIDLSDLKPGKYNFKMSYRNYDPCKGDLLISENKWEIVKHKENMFNIWNPVLFKRPANLIWGTIEFPEASLKADAENFLEDIEREGAILNNLEPGNYDFFFVRKKGKQEMRHLAEGYELPFFYFFTGDMERIKLLMKMYHDRYGDLLKITINDLNGSVTQSWTVK